MNTMPTLPENTMPLPARILIVEDERVLAQNLKKYLARYACDVRTAGDGEQAVQLAADFAPDAVVMDYGLPGMNGVETYAEIVRRLEKKIHCTMITGTPTAQLAQDARNTGISNVLCKPFSFSALLSLLRNTACDAHDGVHYWDKC